jgi:hypothetical protein
MPQPPTRRIPLKGTKGDDFFVRQQDDYSCGPACLATVARIYDTGLDYRQCRAAARPDPDVGTEQSRMNDLCERFFPTEGAGADAYGGEVAIARVMQGGEGHYVVFLKGEGEHVLYYDPYEHELVIDRLDNIEWSEGDGAFPRWTINFTPLPENSIVSWLALAAPKPEPRAPKSAPRRGPRGPRPW